MDISKPKKLIAGQVTEKDLQEVLDGITLPLPGKPGATPTRGETFEINGITFVVKAYSKRTGTLHAARKL